MKDPKHLSDSRIQLHYATQCIAAVGAALVPPQADGSQSTLAWSDEIDGFIGANIAGDRPFYVALEPVSLTSSILDERQHAIATLPLDGKTMAEVLDWHKAELTKLGVKTDGIALLEYPADDFPHHPVAHGKAFEAGGEGDRAVIAAYFARTASLLETIAASEAGASPVRIWPHHFDIATMMTLSGAGEEARTVGVGLSPGDGNNYDQPYWYVSPWPYPPSDILPSLSSGSWHVERWTGAVLLASDVEEDPTSDAFQQIVKAFLEEAAIACKTLVARTKS